MNEGQPSRTAQRVALERAAHQVLDSPLVLEDPLALRVLSPEASSELLQHGERRDASPIAKFTRAIVVVRSRIAEDEIARAASRGVRQYVVLGAGFDTFAYRNPHDSVRVFEVDHPSTQQLKRERLATAGIATPPNATFVACDFDRDALRDALQRAGFDWSAPAVVAWLGVVMYLEHDAVMATLREIATLPAESSVIFDYALPPERLPFVARLFYRRVLDRLAAHGEPWRSFFEPESIGRDLEALGFWVQDLGADEINGRYLAGRQDGLKAGGVGRIVLARSYTAACASAD